MNVFSKWTSAQVVSAAILLSAIVSIGDAAAAAKTWSVTALNSDWNNAANWTGGLPAAGDDVIIANAVFLPTNQNIANLSIRSLVFDASTIVAMTINGNAITLTGSGTALSVDTAAADHTLAVPIVLASDQSWDVGANRTFVINGVISGSGRLTKAGNGRLNLLTATNSYAGGTVINAGILSLGTDGGSNQNDSGLGRGQVTINTGGQLRLGGYGGAVVNSRFINNAVELNGGSIFSIDSAQHLQNGTFNVGVNGGTLFTRYADNKDLFLDSQVTGSGNITVADGGGGSGGSKVHFTNPTNTYNGTITVNSSKVQLDDRMALSAATLNVLANNALVFGAAASIADFLHDGSGLVRAATVVNEHVRAGICQSE